MNKTILTLAAVMALSGGAFAGQSSSKQAPSNCVETRTGAKLDCGATGSVTKTGTASKSGSAESKGPRLGIDIDPWIVPSTF